MHWRPGMPSVSSAGFFFSSRRRHTRLVSDWSFRRVLFRSTRSTAEWFNTAVFVQPGAGIYGTTPRNYLRGPGFNNWDMSLAKSVALTERMHFQLRLDSFNTFNHPHFNAPNSALGGPGFGSINSARPQSGRILQLGAKFQF